MWHTCVKNNMSIFWAPGGLAGSTRGDCDTGGWDPLHRGDCDTKLNNKWLEYNKQVELVVLSVIFFCYSSILCSILSLRVITQDYHSCSNYGIPMWNFTIFTFDHGILQSSGVSLPAHHSPPLKLLLLTLCQGNVFLIFIFKSIFRK